MMPISSMTRLTFGICAVCRRPVVGIIMSGSKTSYAGGLPVARVMDIVMKCHGPAVIISGSSIAYADHMRIARIGDTVAMGYLSAKIITGDMRILVK